MEITEKSRGFIAENAKDALELLTIFRRLTERIQESRAVVMEEVKDLSEEERTAYLESLDQLMITTMGEENFEEFSSYL